MTKELQENPAKKAAKKVTKKVSKKEKTTKKVRQARPKSKSGKYTSISNLMGVLLKQKGMTWEKAQKVVKHEFPDSAFAKDEKTAKRHFAWYNYQLVRKNV